MKVRVPTRRALPDPRSGKFGVKDDGSINDDLLFYFIQMNEEIQALNRQLADTVRDTVSGTLVVDDGASWRLTVVLVQGKVKSIVSAASTGAEATWTPE
jgi:hypothetical protein